MFGAIDCFESIVELFAEAQARQRSNRTARLADWAWKRAQAHEGKGTVEVVGKVAYCKDGYAFECAPPSKESLRARRCCGG